MLALTAILAALIIVVSAAPHGPTRTVEKREPHPAVITLPTPGTEIWAPWDSDISSTPGYFQFPLIMVDGETMSTYARVALTNSSGTYPIGEEIHVYDSWTFEAIVASSLSVVAPGAYVLDVQEQDSSDDGWYTAVSTNVTVYSEMCGTDPTCCWSCCPICP
ncbi:hypothetical protein DACRYDRAFT_21363 [Dacryopinax primogenitus]|uniref:Uncharacterized protein n=1 Tax=Dacryopinax primogenitus (strain DJM 731) TaxID=1858805 RepID=M5GE58_DACPD|nr:uncharacterized protein DACRYDRAFT_21363 [Dacryopinax primogenitus]EJU02998.1 hypothetical protein DACRYDRAFT_21363 [Dacryopinax primogenitus]